MSEHVMLDIVDGVLRVRLTRDAKKNALTSDMYGALADAISQADDDPNVRVLLLAGGEKDFSAGNDLNDFLDPNRDASAVGRFMEALPTAKKPVVAAVNGYAVGVGTTMLLHCDLVYAAKGAKLKMPFVDLGVVPEFGSSLLLPRLVGAQRAAALLMLSETFSGEDAVRYGIATEAVDDDRVQERALDRARYLATRSPTALRRTKELLRAAIADQVEGTWRHESTVFAELLKTDETREAMSALLGKRAPDFSKVR